MLYNSAFFVARVAISLEEADLCLAASDIAPEAGLTAHNPALDHRLREAFLGNPGLGKAPHSLMSKSNVSGYFKTMQENAETLGKLEIPTKYDIFIQATRKAGEQC